MGRGSKQRPSFVVLLLAFAVVFNAAAYPSVQAHIFTNVIRYISFVEDALESSPLAAAITSETRRGDAFARAHVMPDWLRSALSHDRFSLGVEAYFTGIFEACHSTHPALEQCIFYKADYPQIDSALVYGGIRHIWTPDIHAAFSRYTNHLSPSVHVRLSSLHPQQMVARYIQDTWQHMVQELNTYQTEDPTAMRLLIHLTNLFQSPQANVFTGSTILRAWWLSLRVQYDLVQRLLTGYEKWTSDVSAWEIIITPLVAAAASTTGRHTYHHNVTYALSDQTFDLAQRLRHSPYFRISSDQTALIPFSTTVPTVLQTSRASQMLRQYCTMYEPNLKLHHHLMSASYITEPVLMEHLSLALKDRDEWMVAAEAQQHDVTAQLNMMDEQSALAVHSTVIITECLKSTEKLQICEACATQWPPLYFYLSEGLILRDFYQHLPLLMHMQPVKQFAVDAFNQMLINLYLQFRFFFQTVPDALLDAWANTHFAGKDIRDIYQIFRGPDMMWEARPPTAFLLPKLATSTIKHVDFARYPLSFLWRRVIDLFRAHYHTWWTELLIMAKQFDRWVERADVVEAVRFLNNEPLYDVIRAKTLINAVEMMHAVAIRVRMWSGEHIIPEPSVDRALARQLLRLHGHIDALRYVFRACARQSYTPTQRFWRPSRVWKPNPMSIRLPEFPAIPPRAALLHTRNKQRRKTMLLLEKSDGRRQRTTPKSITPVTPIAAAVHQHFHRHNAPSSDMIMIRDDESNTPTIVDAPDMIREHHASIDFLQDEDNNDEEEEQDEYGMISIASPIVSPLLPPPPSPPLRDTTWAIRTKKSMKSLRRMFQDES